jgi:diguanylate cyclase (GGDEF)-like protein
MEGTAPLGAIDSAFIRRTELLSSLFDEDLDYVASRMGTFELKKGGHLFNQGTRADRFYIVLEGSIRVFRSRPDGGSDEMAVFTPGDTLGDFDFARRANYDACAEAREDSLLLSFPGIGLDMDVLARERPDTVARILLQSLAMIASRLRSTQRLISENAPWVQELRRQSFEDPGTGLWNRAFLQEELSRNLQAPFALILLKPDRFKELVDSRGHAAGDEAMMRIAAILKSAVRRAGRGWAIRLKSNEVALAINRWDAENALRVSRGVMKAISGLEPVPANKDIPAFSFTATLAFAIWPADGEEWSLFFDAVYGLLMAGWRAGGNRILRLKPTAAGGAVGA